MRGDANATSSAGLFDAERGAAGDYRPMAQSPALPAVPTDPPSAVARSGERTLSVETMSSGDAHGDQHCTKWRRIVRENRLVEFAYTLLIYVATKMLGRIGVHERDIPRVELRLNETTTIYARDPSLDQTKMREHVPMWSLILFCIAVPIAINLVMNFVLPKFRDVRLIKHDVRDFLLSLGQSLTLATLLVQFTKNMTGRFRPCFYDMCGWDYDVIWDGVTNLCTDPEGEKEGRKSFPSGHSSFAWSTMLVLTLYLLGRSRLNCENRSESMGRGGRKTLKLFLCFVPVLAASWVAITRSIDNWHHYSDILAGSMIGAVSACLAYGYNYGSVFCWESAGLPCEVMHARRKAKYAEAELCCSPRESAVYDSADGLQEESEKFHSSQSERVININTVSRSSSAAWRANRQSDAPDVTRPDKSAPGNSAEA